MTSGLDSVIDIAITRSNVTVARQGFGVILILAPASGSGLTSGQHLEATSVDDVLAGGFLTSDAAYAMAQSAFAQDPRPEKVLIMPTSSAVAQVVTLTPTVANAAVYTVTLDGTVYTFTSDGSATAAEIVTGLNALINADTPLPVTASGSTTSILTSDTAGTPFTYEVSSNLAAVLTTPDNGIEQDIQTAINSGLDFYGILISARTQAVILQAAQKTEAVKRFLFVSNNEANVKNGVAANTLKLLKALNYDRTTFLYSENQVNYPDAAWMGDTFPIDPGGLTFNDRNLNGVVADTLTPTQVSNIENDNGNWYRVIGGVAVTGPGKVVSGEWIDVIRDLDSLEADMQEDVFQVLVDNDKIPFTDAGGSILENVIRARLKLAVKAGILASWTLFVPKVADIPVDDRSARFFTGITFTGVLAGAIHKVKIRGRVSV